MESSAPSEHREQSLRMNQPIPAPEGSPQNAGSIRPTPLLDAKLQRLEQLASVGTLSAGLAHEIKNAMVAIRTFVEMLIAQNKDTELADVVQREVLRIDSIVSQLLGFAGNPKSRLREFRLTETLDRCLRLVEPQLKARNIRLRRSFRARYDRVQGDADRLEQAFINILLNAIEAIGEKGELVLTTATQKPNRRKKKAGASSLSICVRDSGPGISKQELPRIFEPFYTSKPEGTGLGLAITREIIEQHHGTISAESKLGKGTSFSVTLPLAPTARKKPARKR